jgi:hypothetical protein
MLPAPFYAELPADLGDDQTWAHLRAAGQQRENGLAHRPSPSWRALASWFRRVWAS